MLAQPATVDAQPLRSSLRGQANAQMSGQTEGAPHRATSLKRPPSPSTNDQGFDGVEESAQLRVFAAR